jgi:hypothetical protein
VGEWLVKESGLGGRGVHDGSQVLHAGTGVRGSGRSCSELTKAGVKNVVYQRYDSLARKSVMCQFSGQTTEPPALNWREYVNMIPNGHSLAHSRPLTLPHTT